ncbi:MAG: CocE/NonD family hydrolase [Pseudomonadota bacterium]
MSAMLRVLAVLLLVLPAWSWAQDIGFQPPRGPDDVAAVAVMHEFAERIVPVYRDADIDAYLTNLTALQTVSGDYRSARDSNDQLRKRQQQNRPLDGAVESALADGIYAHARQIEANERLAFAEAYARAFAEGVAPLDNLQSAALSARLQAPLAVYREPVRLAFDRWRLRGSVPQADAVALVRTWLAYESRRSFAVQLPELVASDNRRRYVTDANVEIPLRRGGVLHASVVRPVTAKGPVPTLLRLTLDPIEDDARRSARHGYVGVTAYVRGRKPDGTGDVWPFVTEGDDAVAVIEWIARQPWSDGRVAMLGDGYSGYTAWAAASRRPAALKAIATIAPMAPGIDFPMAGQIYRNDFVRWIAEQAVGKSSTRADAAPETDAAWQARNARWYRQGGPYQEVDRALLGRHSPLAQQWLSHPSHDRYWQKRLPSAKQFAQIDIPVLGIGGYFDASAGALYFHNEHRLHRPQADTTLLVGPFGAASSRGGTGAALRGHALDAVARVDLPELRYRWLDHIFHKAKKPALLEARVNLQVMGADRWRHAPTLDAPDRARLKLHLDTRQREGPHRLLSSKPSASSDHQGQAQLKVDLAGRRDAGVPGSDALRLKTLPTSNSIRFVSDPLSKDTDVHGSLRGEFDITPSRQDVDLSVALYEQTASGEHQLLFEPYDFRASYAGNRVKRRLLQAGVRQSMAFTTERVTARKLAAGSRLVLVVGINKRPDRQINYGSGQDVNAETKAADAESPIRVRWHPGSHVDIQTGP